MAHLASTDSRVPSACFDYIDYGILDFKFSDGIDLINEGNGPIKPRSNNIAPIQPDQIRKTVENILESWKAVALQRLLKAIGSFSYLGKKAGKQYFYQYITPSIELLANLDLHNENWPYLSQTLIKGLKNATNR